MSLTPAHPGGLGGGGKAGGKAGGGLRVTAAHSPHGVSTGVYVRGGARRGSGGELALGEWRWKPSGTWAPILDPTYHSDRREGYDIVHVHVRHRRCWCCGSQQQGRSILASINLECFSLLGEDSLIPPDPKPLCSGCLASLRLAPEFGVEHRVPGVNFY